MIHSPWACFRIIEKSIVARFSRYILKCCQFMRLRSKKQPRNIARIISYILEVSTKAYTVECAGLSTVGLEFCVVVACQLHPLGDSRITVTEHPHIEFHITVEDVLNPSILYIELQADVGNLVILR